LRDGVAGGQARAVDPSDGGYVFYGDLAPWWPLISPPEDYEQEASELADLLVSGDVPVHDVLELGSGGGHNASHLSRRFALTLVDASPAMLLESRRLNPTCAHVVGDMRAVRLGRRFDAVLVHDAIDYMTTEEDLRAVLATAHAHCRPGGVLVLAPDHTRETFTPGTDHGGVDGPDGRGVRYLEWTTDPDPDDTEVTTDYAFLLREPGGAVRAVHETHTTGLFDRATWLRLLAEAGFAPHRVVERSAQDHPARDLFLGRRLEG
jgi:SAM-dependent methyltransferase